MHAFSIVGDGAAEFADRLPPALSGRVAVVRVRGDRDGAGAPASDGGRVAPPAGANADGVAAPTTYDLDEDGWRARGDGLSLEAALDRLAPDHDVAAVLGAPDARLPRVVLGGESEAGAGAAEGAPAEEGPGGAPGRTVYRAPDAASADPDAVARAVADTEPRETLESLVARVKRSSRTDRGGAVATFTGRVRARDGDDDPRTERLEFEKYEGVADRTMAAIESDLEAREGVLEVALHHRTGVVPAGEDIVFVVVLAGHRREAFRAVEDGIDRLKDEVPLFKKEVTADETFWVHERD